MNSSEKEASNAGKTRIKKLKKRFCQMCHAQIEERNGTKDFQMVMPHVNLDSDPEPSAVTQVVSEASSSSSDVADESEEDEQDPLQVVMDKVIQDDSILDWWRKTSGLHTVEKWVKNYRKHPAGWAALLMIHGVPEITGRLRSKVENYAIYAALFLSAAIPTMFIPWDPLVMCGSEDSEGRRLAKVKGSQGGGSVSSETDWECEIRKRIFFYFLGAGIAAHMLCIMLSMAFVNALNEAARDSDVFRMFARGQGFKATVKCQVAFRAGAAFDLISMLAAAHLFMGWEAVVFAIVCVGVVLKIYFQTAGLLFRNTSIVKYWREELGGKPDADDPYDLDIPVERFSSRVEEGKEFSKLYSLKHRKSRKSSRPSAKVQEHYRHGQMSPKVFGQDKTNQGVASGWL